MLLRCSPPPFSRPCPVFQPFVPPAAALLAALSLFAGRVVFHGNLSVPECDGGAAMLLFQQFTEFFAARHESRGGPVPALS